MSETCLPISHARLTRTSRIYSTWQYIRIPLVVYRFNRFPFYASVNISAYVVFSKSHRAVNITVLQYLQRYINFFINLHL